MNDARRSWKPTPADGTVAGPRLHVVSRMTAPQPRWGVLYATLGIVAVLGTAAHFALDGSVLVRVADGAFAFVLFLTLAGWVHLNRMALTRLGEPAAGGERARVRIVRSRKRPAEEAYADEGVVRLEPDERVVLPYDFR